MVGRCTESGKEVQELCLFCFANALKFKHLAKVGIGFVGNMDQVGLYKGFGWRGADLQCLEERINL